MSPASRKQPNAYGMQRALAEPIPELPLPSGFALRTLETADGPAVHALLASAYAGGGGRVGSYESWRRDFLEDVEFDAASCFLAFDGERLVGAALCFSSAFLKDLVIDEAYRRRGLGAALLAHALRHFAARGEHRVTLKVEEHNPSGAERLYARLGFERQPECWVTRLESAS